MKVTLELIHGLPKTELIQKIHFYHRQGQIADRALGFYLLELEKSKHYRPLEDAAVWAVKHLDKVKRPDKLIHLARRLDQLHEIEAAFHSGEVPWTKIREIARIATPDTEQVWLEKARRLTSRQLEAEVTGKKRGDRPGGGLKAKRMKQEVRLRFSGEDLAIWEKGIRMMMKEIGPGATPDKAAVEIMRRTLARGRQDNAAPTPSERVASREIELLVYHVGRDGTPWVNVRKGRVEIDPAVIEEKVRSGARIIEVRDVEGAGVCAAIKFGERGKVAPEDRDVPVSPELKEAVLARDEGCVVCGATENLSPHHLDSHADGGKSDMRRLVTLCLDRCQGAVHDGDVILRVEDDGTVTALDREGRVIGKPQSSAEVLAEADETCPLEVLERRGLPAARPAPESAPEEGREAQQSAPPEASAETREFRSLDSLDDLPSELTASQWRALEATIEWSPTHRAFLFRPDGRDLAEFLDPLQVVASLPTDGATGAAPVTSGVRPGSFGEFVGQRRAVDNLLLAASAAKARGEPLGHVLISGQPGLGKTTVGRLLARECGAGLVEVLAGTIGDPHQLVSLLCRLQRGQHLLIDEVHRLQDTCQECLYPALEDGIVNVVLREGGRTRAVRVRLEPFTLVGATTCLGMLSKPFRDRFPLRETLDHYGSDDLAEVVVKAAGRLGTTASPEAALDVALRSRGTPREAIRILERARDVAQVWGAPDIAVAHVDQAAKRLGIDRRGLDHVERKAVRLLLRRGRAISLDSIAKQLGVDLKTFQDVHEAWLERSGLVERTPEGRIATKRARALYGSKRTRTPRNVLPGPTGRPRSGGDGRTESGAPAIMT